MSSQRKMLADLERLRDRKRMDVFDAIEKELERAQEAEEKAVARERDRAAKSISTHIRSKGLPLSPNIDRVRSAIGTGYHREIKIDRSKVAECRKTDAIEKKRDDAFQKIARHAARVKSEILGDGYLSSGQDALDKFSKTNFI